MGAPTDQTTPTICDVTDESSLISVRGAVRTAAADLGFGVVAQTKLVTAASELARNIFRYAGVGRMTVTPVEENGEVGVRVRFEDDGPGIENIDLALRDGYSSGGSLGIGLPGARRLVDLLEIDSRPGQGTVVVITTWLS